MEWNTPLSKPRYSSWNVVDTLYTPTHAQEIVAYGIHGRANGFLDTWLADWLAGWLARWLAAGWQAGRLAGCWLAGRPAGF